MKKNFKLVLALVLSIMMVLGSFAALAEAPDTSDATTAVQRYNADSGNLVRDGSLTIKGLETGDAVTYYQIVKFDQDAKDTKGWTWISADFAAAITAAGGTPATILNNIINKQISFADAEILAKVAKNSLTAETVAGNTPLAAGDNGVWTATIAANGGTAPQVGLDKAGMYIAIIAAGKAGVIYNPVLLGIDYYTDNSSIIQLVDNDTGYLASSTGIAKKQVIDLEKTASTITETKVGSDVTFYIETTIPLYPANYTKPHFKLSDTMSAGLTLKADTIKVYSGVTKAEFLADSQPATLTLLKTGTGTETDVVTVEATDGQHFTVDFAQKYIEDAPASTKILVVYDATIESEALMSVNPEQNDVILEYSNNPDNESGYGHMKDGTNHYTFDIDGELFGRRDYSATEIVKVGLDADGNEILESKTLANGYWVGALENAEFEIFTDLACTAKYVNKFYDANSVITTDAWGRMNIKGLAADVVISNNGVKKTEENDENTYRGTYYVKEKTAPAGYVKDPNVYTIVITANTKVEKVTEVVEGDTDDYLIEYLQDYNVTINGIETASYTIVNSEDKSALSANNDDDVIGKYGPIASDDTGDLKTSEAAGKVQNTQGVELPSTGGIGTTIFYIGGSLMVLAAAILLITKRRMGAED